MAITHHFRRCTDVHGYGYFAYIEDNKLVIGEHWPHEGGVLYEGNYLNSVMLLERLKEKCPSLCGDIVKYFDEHPYECNGWKDNPQPKKDASEKGTEKTYKAKVHMDNGETHIILVRSNSPDGLVKRLTINKEWSFANTLDGRGFAVRSDKVNAIEFLGEL